jgi:hypothetical protein
MAATSSCLQLLLEEKSVRKHHTAAGIVCKRVDRRTRAASTP